MLKARALMDRSIDRNFASSGRPKHWKPLARVTLMQKLKAGYSLMPLIRSGARGLQGSISSRTRNNKLAIGTSIAYGRIHQFGGFAGRNRRVFIPARPYLVFQEEDLKRIEILIARYLAGMDS